MYVFKGKFLKPLIKTKIVSCGLKIFTFPYSVFFATGLSLIIKICTNIQVHIRDVVYQSGKNAISVKQFVVMLEKVSADLNDSVLNYKSFD